MNTHTAGEWTVEGSTQTVVMCDGVKVAKASYDMLPSQEAQANARLIAEAGTVANETGMTPRQLQAINAELVDFAEIVARSACLQQRMSDKCICFSCEARRLLAKSNQ